LRNTPFVPILLCFSVGVGLGWELDIWHWPFLALSFSLLNFLWLYLIQLPERKILASILICILGALHSSAARPVISTSQSGEVLYSLQIVSVMRKEGRYRQRFRARSLGAQGSNPRFMELVLDGPSQKRLSKGDQLQTTGRLRTLGASRKRLLARWDHIKPYVPSRWTQLRVFRQYLETQLKSLPADQQALLKGILFGEKRGLTAKRRALFRRTGTSHLLAVSGLHVSLIAAMILFVVRFSFVRPAWQIIIASLAIWFYVFLAGGRPASLRAGLLISFYFLSRLLGTAKHPWNLLAFAGFLLLLWNPRFLADPGTQLSFATFSGILSIQPTLNTLKSQGMGRFLWFQRVAQWTTTSLCITSAAFASGALVVLCHFGRLEPTALIANLPSLPIFTLLLGSSFAGVLLSCLHPILGWPFLQASSVLSSLLFAWLTLCDGLLPSIQRLNHGPLLPVLPISALICSLSVLYGSPKSTVALIGTQLIFMTWILGASTQTAPLTRREVGGTKTQSINSTRSTSPAIWIDGRKVLVRSGDDGPWRTLAIPWRQRGSWAYGPWEIDMLYPGLCCLESGAFQVLIIRDSPGLARHMSLKDIPQSPMVICQTRLSRKSERALESAWLGSTIVFQRSFPSRLSSDLVIHESQVKVRMSAPGELHLPGRTIEIPE
jgi:ComEC/Rec2-related protein